MAQFNPFFNEDTGWTPLDEMQPWQQALLNPGTGNLTNPGYNGNDPFYQFTQFGGTQPGQLPAGTNPFAVSNGIVGAPGFTTGSNPGGNGYTAPSNFNTTDPSFIFNNANRTPRNTPPPIIGSPSLAPTGSQVQQNPQAYAGTSFDPNRTLMSGLNYPQGGANNMQMTGAGTQSYGGTTYGSYTGSNGPLNTQLFNQQAGNTTPQFDYVRQIDQVSYQKYILPLQMAGLIDISNPQQVQAAITQGLARDGGGQWSQGAPGTTASVGNVQGSPYARFLQSGDPRAQTLNQFMLSGDQNAIAAANDWMSKNVRQDGTTANPLDNIDAWKQRFSQIYFPNNQFNPSSITPSNSAPPPGGSTPPPGGGQQTPVNNDWYAEFTAQNPNSRTQYNKQLDAWALRQLSPSQRAQFEGKTDPQTLAAYRTALDQIRNRAGYTSWNNVNQFALNNNAQTSWLAQGYEDAPFAPGADPGQYFKWDWADADPNDQNNPNNWYLRMNNPQGYQDVQAALEYYNANLRQNGANIIDNPYFVKGADGQYVPVSNLMFNQLGNSPWQTYNQQVNAFLANELDPNLTADPFRVLTDNTATQQYLEALDNIRRQRGYMTNSGVMSLAQQPGNVPLNSYVGSPAGTPFRPNAAPGQGFAWEWIDDDGPQGAAPGTWGQRLIGSPTTLQQATQYADYMNQNSGFRFTGNNFGNMFNQENAPTGGYRWSPKTSFFQPQQTTPPPGGGQNTNSGPDFSSLFNSLYPPANLYPGVGSGTGTSSGGGGTGTGTPSGSGTGSGSSTQFNPWGRATRNTNSFSNNFNYYGW